jgi:hypothetical protein
MLRGSGKTIDDGAFFKSHRHIMLARASDEFFNAIAVAPTGYNDALKRAAAFQRFANSMNSC